MSVAEDARSSDQGLSIFDKDFGTFRKLRYMKKRIYLIACTVDEENHLTWKDI